MRFNSTLLLPLDRQTGGQTDTQTHTETESDTLPIWDIGSSKDLKQNSLQARIICTK